MNFETFLPKQTRKIAASLLRKIAKLRRTKKTAFVIALSGELGSGKTTFVQGFLKAGGVVKKKITSPTFVLIKNYKLKIMNYRRYGYKRIYHIDCYRIKKPSELTNLGLEKVLKNPKNIVLIEWAEKIRRILPKNAVWIKFKHGGKENERIINLRATGLKISISD